jgi:hypothetical protein
VFVIIKLVPGTDFPKKMDSDWKKVGINVANNFVISTEDPDCGRAIDSDPLPLRQKKCLKGIASRSRYCVNRP